MKRLFLLSLFLLVGVLFTIVINGCGIFGSSGSPTLTLKAVLPAASISSSSISTSSSTNVKKLILVTQYSFKIVEVTGPDMNVDVSYAVGLPLGVLFIDGDNKLLGTLTMTTTGGDLSILPLTKLNGSEIDLGGITFSNGLATPEADPIIAGGPIDMTAGEKADVARLNDIITGILKSPDIDRNGIVDFLENKYFKFLFQYCYNIGSFPAYDSSQNDAAVSVTPFSPARLDGFWIRAYTLSASSTSSDTAWGGNPVWPIRFPPAYTETHTANSGQYTQQMTPVSPVANTRIPVPGTYEVDSPDAAGGTLYFNVGDQQPVVDNIVVPVPVFNVSGGKLQSITWTWHMINDPTGPEIDPTWFMDHYLIQITKITAATNTFTRIYDSVSLSGSIKSHTLATPQTWSDCDSIDFSYYDKFGNMIGVNHTRTGIL